MPSARPHAAAFTLVEMILATVLIGLVAAGTVTALTSAVRSRDAATARAAAFERAVTATSLIADDLVNIVRDANPSSFRVLITPVETAGASGPTRADTIMLESLDLRRTRPEPLGPGTGTAESIVHEVQYRAESTSGLAGLALWRRDDPTPDEYLDAGGVARVVAPGVVSVLIQAADEVNWRDSWDSDVDGYPHAVRVTVIAADDTGKYTSTARRTVAIDRTPLPITASEEPTVNPNLPASTDTGATGNTGSTTNGGAAAGGGGGNRRPAPGAGGGNRGPGAGRGAAGGAGGGAAGAGGGPPAGGGGQGGAGGGGGQRPGGGGAGGGARGGGGGARGGGGGGARGGGG